MPEDGRVAPDGGYGWIVIFCCILINSCLLPLTQCFALIYAYEFVAMGVSAEQKSFLLHLHNFMYCIMGIFSGPLLKVINFRQAALIGSAIMCFGIFITTFVDSYPGLIFTVGCIIGLGQGILLPGLYMAVNTYFKQKLTLAISVQVTGASITNVFMPYVCNYLLQEFGVHGTVFILSAISFNALPLAVLMRPLTPRKPKLRSDLPSNDRLHVSERLLSSAVYRETTVPAKTKQRWYESLIKMFDLELLCNRTYVLIVLVMGISFASELNIVLMVPFVLMELAAFDNHQVAVAMSVQAVFDIVGRLAVPWVIYKANVNPKIMYSISLLGASLGRSLLSYFYGDSSVVYLTCVLLGLAKGIKAVYQSVIIPKYIQSDKLAAAIGLNYVANGFFSIFLGWLLGYIHDMTDTYVASLHFATALSLSCVGLWILELLFCHKKSKETRENNDVFTIDTQETNQT